MLRSLFFLLLVPFWTHCLTAQQTISWKASGIGSWSTAGNWDCNCVPTSMDTVFIGHDSVFVDNGFQAFASRIVLGSNMSSASLGIRALGGLTVNGSEKVGISVVNGSTLLNLGKLTIMNAVSHGLANSGLSTIINQTGASLSISMIADSNGLYNRGALINHGSIDIDSVGLNGLENQSSTGALTNMGTISITTAGREGIFNHEQASIHNQAAGSITVSDTEWRGILNEAEITNHGAFQLLHTDLVGFQNNNMAGCFLDNFGQIRIDSTVRSGLQNGAMTHNRPGGLIAIKDVLNNFQYGFNNISTLENEGKITIEDPSDDGLQNLGVLNNHDTITIHNTGNRALVHNNGTLTNHQNGFIGINWDGPVPKEPGIWSAAVFKNDGSLMIINSSQAVSVSDSLVNNGRLDIKESSGGFTISGYFENNDTVVCEARRGVTVSGDFINNHWISLTPDGTGQYGMSISGVATNLGELKILDLPCGIEATSNVFSDGVFINQDFLHIVGSTSGALKLERADTRMEFSAGSLTTIHISSGSMIEVIEGAEIIVEGELTTQ